MTDLKEEIAGLEPTEPNLQNAPESAPDPFFEAPAPEAPQPPSQQYGQTPQSQNPYPQQAPYAPQNPYKQPYPQAAGVPQYQPLFQQGQPGNIGAIEGVPPLLQLQNVTKSYGHKLAVNQANLNVYPGRIVGLLGPNGSGKTTIIKMVSGILVPSTGKIFVDGREPGVETKAIVSYLPERTYLDDSMRAQDAVNYFRDFYKDFDAQRALEMLGHLGIDSKDRIKAMSKGTREKVQLILVMSRRARLYLLDEPIGGVDPAARDYILRTILGNYSPHSTVILSTHLIHDIEQALDDVIFINQGQIVLTSSVDDIRSNYGKSVDDLFREVFRC